MTTQTYLVCYQYRTNTGWGVGNGDVTLTTVTDRPTIKDIRILESALGQALRDKGVAEPLGPVTITNLIPIDPIQE
jgi:hypothetical protein